MKAKRQKKNLTDIVLEDFRKISRKAFRNFGKKKSKSIFQNGKKQIMTYNEKFGEAILYPNGIAWFAGLEGHWKPLGKPEDYLAIKDDSGKLKDFLAKLLDRGKLYYGTAYWNQDGETNTSDYVIWLHSHCENNEFKKNLENAVIELLREELNRKFEPLNYEEGMKLALDFFQKFDKGDIDKLGQMFNTDRVPGAISRAGLSYPETAEDEKMKKEFEKEMKKTLRTITHGRTYKAVNFKAASPEFKEKFKKWHLDKRAKENTVNKFTPQFNRIIGLFDIVSNLGKKNKEFRKAAGLLEEKAKQGFFKDAPNLQYNFSGANIYNHLLWALKSVQTDDHLKDFWLEEIATDPNQFRVLTSVNNLLMTYKTKKERRKQIPAILERIHKRKYDVDKTVYRSVIGFILDNNLLDKILLNIELLCFDKKKFCYLNKKSAALDLLEHKEIEKGNYKFGFVRYTLNGRKKLEASYDLANDKINGDKRLEESVRAYFEKGYELPAEVWVTSLEGREIKRKTKIVEADSQNLKGKYEGIIGLNYNYFPFLYDPKKKKVLLAEPFESRFIGFGVKENWEQRRKGLDNIEQKIPYEKFNSLDTIGEAINKTIKELTKKNRLCESIYRLHNKLSNKLAPYIANIFDVRLIKFKDGLIK